MQTSSLLRSRRLPCAKLTTDVCVRSEVARNGRHIVPKQAYAQLRVAAEVALRTLHHAAPRTHDNDEDAAPAKRQKAR